MENDLRIRLADFNWIKNQVEIHGDILARDLLQQGIFKPQIGADGILRISSIDERFR